MVNKWLLFILVASLMFGAAAGTALKGDIDWHVEDTRQESEDTTEETRQYARGYIRVSSVTTGGWLPLPDEEDYVFPLRQTLMDGTFVDNADIRELYDALTEGASWHIPDHYYVLGDLQSYCDRKLDALRDYKADRMAFTRKQWHNIFHAGKFSSDRTIAMTLFSVGIDSYRDRGSRIPSFWTQMNERERPIL